jgi:hypothetical protein
VEQTEQLTRQFPGISIAPQFHHLADLLTSTPAPALANAGRTRAARREPVWRDSACGDSVLSRRLLLRAGLATLMGLGLFGKQAIGNDAAPIPMPGSESPSSNSTGPDARDVAKQIIPFDRLTGQTQDRLWSVINRTSMYRRLPEQPIVCDPDLYLFLLRNPEVVINMWQLLGVTSMQLKRAGNFVFDAKDNAGTQARVELVYGTPDTHIFLADGAYEGQLLKRRTPGRCVIVLKTDYGRDPAPQSKITSQLDAFVQVDPAGADLVVRTLQPVIARTAEHNFRETLLFVSRVSQALEKSSLGVPHLASRLTALEASVREKFVQIATNVHHRAVLRNPEAHSELPLTADEQDGSIAPVNSVQPGGSRAAMPIRRAG